MNTDRLTELLEKAFRADPERLHGGKVWRLKRPRPLAPLLNKVLDTEQERDLCGGSFEAWPGTVWELLETHRLHRPLLNVHWDGFGPVSWSAGLAAIETGRRTCLCVWDEFESYRLLAAARRQAIRQRSPPSSPNYWPVARWSGIRRWPSSRGSTRSSRHAQLGPVTTSVGSRRGVGFRSPA
jgi:hypothetical protein